MSEAEPTPTEDLVFAEGDPTVFLNHYPTLDDLLAKGGIEGVEYCLVHGKNLRKFSQMENMAKERWSPIRDLPTLTIIGPAGRVDSVVLMGRGDPTYGAADYNGIRQFYVDIDVEETTGLPANPESPLATKTTNLPVEKALDERGGKKPKAEAKPEPKPEDIQVIKGK